MRGVFILLLLVFPLSCFAQELKLDLKSDKEIYKVGEEIRITWELKNVSGEIQKIMLLPENHLNYPGILAFSSFKIIKDGITLKAYRSIDRKDIVFVNEIIKPLSAGESCSGEFDLTKLDWDKNPFTQVGNYEISINYQGIKSKSITFRIRE